MSNYPVNTVSVVLATASATRAGFGTPIFISSNRSVLNRVGVYASASDVADDFGSGSPTHQAALQYFSNTPSVPNILIGRREAVGTYTPVNMVAGSSHKLTVTVDGGDAVTVEYTFVDGQTAEDVVNAFVSGINGDTEVAAKVTAGLSGTGSSAVLTMTPVSASDNYTVTKTTNVDASFTSTESAADVIAAIQDETDAFYFVTAEDHSETFVMEMAAVVQAMNKQYFVSTQTFTTLTPYNESVTDLAGKLKTNNYDRTVHIWDEEADTKFPECTFAGKNAPYSPDETAVVWYGQELPGLSVALNQTGFELTPTQWGYLNARNSSFIASTTLGPRVIGGKTSGNKWIDDIRTADCMAARVQEALDTLTLNVPGTKVPGGKAGVVAVENAIKGALNPFIQSGAISKYTIDSSKASIDQVTRKLSGLTFTCILRGAIVQVDATGYLVNEVL